MVEEKVLGYFDSHERLLSFLQSCPLFKDLDKKACSDLAKVLLAKKIPAGTLLYSEKHPPEGVYIVVQGRLAVYKNDDTVPIWELSSKDHTGDSVILTHLVQPLHVKALRDSDLLIIPKEQFLQFLQKHPIALKNICKELGSFLHQSIAGFPAKKKPAKVIALLPHSKEVHVHALGKDLASYLLLAVCISQKEATEMHPGLDLKRISSQDRSKLSHSLTRLEEDHSFLFLICEHNPSDWTKFCLQSADQIFIFAKGDAKAFLSEAENWLFSSDHVLARKDLILLHEEKKKPKGTQEWFQERKITSHQHVYPKDKHSLERLARIISGKGVGLVLSGGGARGIAQIGFLMAALEKNAPIDFIGGTSVGSIIAALYALGWNWNDLNTKTADIFVHEGGLIDMTFPFAALLKGQKAYDKIVKHTGEICIEDLPTPFFCMSSNMTLKEPKIHQRGLLREALRASISLPGIFPPVYSQHEILVDGGLFNVLPVDVMAEHFDAGRMIGIDSSANLESKHYENFPPSVSGWKLLWEKWRGYRKKVPPIMSILSRTTEISGQRKKRSVTQQKIADFILRPPVGQYGTLEFESYEKIKNIGYEYALEQWETWAKIWTP